ncbi:MAG TPA: two-component regulator propeller domain-containing protein [Verrucomicrobiae bacterium]|nr:two-component regulator propeller domain-containing protein [Verrucomicrobiae bacterium]
MSGNTDTPKQWYMVRPTVTPGSACADGLEEAPPAMTVLGRAHAWMVALVFCAGLTTPNLLQAMLLWSDLGATQVHETGAGIDILGGVLQRNDSSTDTLYFKFHVDPLSDATTEEYFAAFQLFEGREERLAVGNALKAWAYSAFATGVTGSSNRVVEYIDLHSAKPETTGIGAFQTYELPRWGIERTLVFKVQYVPGGNDLVTVWLDPNLRPGATEAAQLESLTTRFNARASFDQIHLRHGGGGAGWIFSEMAIATAFSDLVNASDSSAGGEAPFTFRAWQREQGLSENYVRALAQTRDGYIWVGSEQGVSRFDGMNFFSLGLQEGFQGGPIRVLFGDSRGALWIGSGGSGLSCWQAGKLRKFTTRDGLPSDTISALAEDGRERLWVGTPAGLAVWQDGRFGPVPGAEIFNGKAITALCCDHKGTMWAGATGVGVWFVQSNRFVQLQQPGVESLLEQPHCLLVDRKDRIWIGAGDASVLCRDGHQWRRFGMPRHLATHSISALAEGPDETVWAGSAGEGLFEFKAGKLVAINASSGLCDTMVEALLVDQEGKVWVGTQGGLNRICARYVSVLSHSDGLGYGAVGGLAKVAPGEIWASQPHQGVFGWDGQRFSRLLLEGLPAREPGVSTLLADSDGGCWVAGNFGLLHFRNAHAADKQPGLPALTNLDIRALGQDPKTREVWAGSTSGELWHLSRGQWVAEPNMPGGHPITAIAPDANGVVWVGTEGDGLYRVDPATHVASQRMRGLPGGWVRALYLDAAGTLWIGTAGGLSRLRNGELATLTMREGLPDNSISQILEDGSGNLWLGGNRGIFRVNKQDLEQAAAHRLAAVYPQVYGRPEGMLSEECVSGFSPAGLKTGDGLLWFVTLKGIVVVDPRHTMTAPAPPVVLEQMLVDGMPVAQHEGPLRVGPGKHTLEFHYAGLNFDVPERVRFRYRLEGLDPNWIEAGTRRVALYSYVPPGSYHFRVSACNGGGVWNANGVGMELTVLPEIWQTWWFLGTTAAAALMLCLGGLRFVVRRRMQQRLQRLEQDRVLERERTRIAQDLHDIMGAKLCRISFMSEHVRRSETIPAPLKEQIGSMSDDSREVLRSLDEIVWAVNPAKDSLEHLVSYIAQYAQDYFRRTGIECALEVPARLPAQPLTSQSRHHLFLAVHEALTNILKHSGATRARLEMLCAGAEFEITISDNGRGFDPAANGASSPTAVAGFGNGLGNMRRRLRELGGDCLLQSRPGEGTTVRFVLPLNQVVS